MKIGKKFKVKETIKGLYRKGDIFEIVKINDDPDLMTIEAMRLKDGETYGFEEEDTEDGC